MNTISSAQSVIDLYTQKKIQAAKVLEQIETEDTIQSVFENSIDQ